MVSASKKRVTNLMQEVLRQTMDLACEIVEKKGRRIVVMEVCGTHTTAFARSGLTRYFARVLELRSGPGCPVCVTHQQDIDYIVALASLEEVLMVTFGDMMRVPGSVSSLEQAKARGARVHLCYSPLEALSWAQRYPRKQVILTGIGFETTAPAIASTLLEAKKNHIDNFTIYTTLKLVPPALRALLQKQSFNLDGLILPGHVCAVTGSKAFDFTAWQYGLPSVVTGFAEPDLLAGLFQLLTMIKQNEISVRNAYPSVVREYGNRKAQEIVEQCFAVTDFLWRGFSIIPKSGYRLKGENSIFEARDRFKLELPQAGELPGCRCGEIICGTSSPLQCSLFKDLCTPSKPVGPCMVSAEGACNAYFQHLAEAT
ncbi:MAG: hydrogenase formation protein HypD [Dethiobacteria bacterium]|jgi:hydrogenase expression/formation protein HypD|nr:hydrogenase formation protein HypD [Bacillota bacterium]